MKKIFRKKEKRLKKIQIEWITAWLNERAGERMEEDHRK